MATTPSRRRLLLAVALVTSVVAALSACTIEFIDNDDDDDLGTPDGGSSGWGDAPWGVPDAMELDSVSPPVEDGGSGPWPDAQAAVCGNGFVEGAEQCDNGQPGVNTAACDRDCTLALCGDALANFPAGEQCDTGTASVSCDVDCTAVVCGDGLVNTVAGEQCDDGNAVDNDACRNDCTLP